MLNAGNKELCERCIDQHRTNEGVWVLSIEEMSELQKEICKLLRYGYSSALFENLTEEIVDVIVMCQQLLIVMGISMDEVNRRAKEKLERALR